MRSKHEENRLCASSDDQGHKFMAFLYSLMPGVKKRPKNPAIRWLFRFETPAISIVSMALSLVFGNHQARVRLKHAETRLGASIDGQAHTFMALLN